jgi:chromosome segregation ATPase
MDDEREKLVAARDDVYRQWVEAYSHWLEARCHWVVARRQWVDANRQWEVARRQWEVARRQLDVARRQWVDANRQWDEARRQLYVARCQWDEACRQLDEAAGQLDEANRRLDAADRQLSEYDERRGRTEVESDRDSLKLRLAELIATHKKTVAGLTRERDEEVSVLRERWKVSREACYERAEERDTAIVPGESAGSGAAERLHRETWLRLERDELIIKRDELIPRVAALEAEAKKLRQCPDCSGEGQHDCGARDQHDQWTNSDGEPCEGCKSTGTIDGFFAVSKTLRDRVRKLEVEEIGLRGDVKAAEKEAEKLREQLESVADRAAAAETALEARTSTAGEGSCAAPPESGGGEPVGEKPELPTG